LNISIGYLEGLCVVALVPNGLVMKTSLKELCELIGIFSICKQEVKLTLVTWIKNEHEGDHIYGQVSGDYFWIDFNLLFM